ncbi:MAG: DNA translocase FtsK 4TM domain-containing protein [Elusimicrobia bacterium]|nr:DNA translocase FtsK 4TM domain-containing protein [Elusimicrobiota bacterium]
MPKPPKRRRKTWRFIFSFFTLASAGVSAGALYWTQGLGPFGRWLADGMLGLLGWPAYCWPPFFFWIGLRAWRGRTSTGSDLAFTVEHLGVPLAGGFLGELTWGLLIAGQQDIAGHLALSLAGGLISRIGFLGAWGMTVLAWAAWLWFIFEIPWVSLLKKGMQALYADWKSWRKELLERRRLAASLEPKLKTVNGGETAVIKVRVPEADEPKGQETPVAAVAISAPAPLRKTAKEKPAVVAAPAPAVGVAGDLSWTRPPLELLAASEHRSGSWAKEDELVRRGQDLVSALGNFEVAVELDGIVPGPVVTRYDVIPKPGVKVGEIVNLTSDIALALKVGGVRILGPIAGRGAIGIEVPNPRPTLVRLREVLEDPAMNASGRLPFALGRSASGEPVTADLTDMPHLLIAGATNSGKSVLIHTLVVSFLYRLTPDELKLVLIDPKRLELPFYDRIPHLFNPRVTAAEVKVITDSKEAAKTLAAMVDLMEARYERLAQKSARNIDAYNRMAKSDGFAPEPYVAVIIDELADLMLVAGKEVENSIQRLAQMARAVGIHLVLATQRPSVDVITGVIKANLPARIALQVVSKIDSRVILDTQGAENLLGAGDMLYLASGAQRPVRIQGAYVSDAEINRVVERWAKQGPPNYPEPAALMGLPAKEGQEGPASREDAENLSRALKLVLERRRVSQDLLKAHFGSSARATDILSRLEIGGFIMKPEGTNRWEIRYDRIEDYLANNKVDS